MRCRGAVHDYDEHGVCRDCGWVKRTREDFVIETAARAEKFSKLRVPKSAAAWAKGKR